MRTLLVTLVALLVSLPLDAQTVNADRYRLATGPCFLRSGSGTPEGAVTGNICDLYVNTVNGVWYTKWTGTNTNTGWGVGHNANATITGNLDTTGYVSVPGYVSQLTGYRVTAAGAGDFRYLFADELHAKSFIADLEQALAGGQIICKSVTSLGSNFTNPGTSGTATLTVRDLPSAENVATFQSGDYVGVRTFARTAGALTIGESFGVVTSYADQAGGVQTWTFTRGAGANGGGMATSTVVATDAVVIDYGVSGNGCHEVNALDGSNSVNSPYAQTWTWTTSPIAANRVLRTRVGNLTGITAVSNEYGSVLGTFGTGTAQYVRASNSAVEMHNVNVSMYSGATEVIKLDRTAPSLAIGSAVPSAYGTGTGVWMGNDGGTYKFRVGIPGGAGLFWDGATLTVRGTSGSGRNLLANSECRVGVEGWSAGTTSAGTPGVGTNLGLVGDYTPAYPVVESSTCYLTTSGTPAVSTVSFSQGSPSFAVITGRRYEMSAALGLIRATNIYLQLDWRNAAGGLVSSSTSVPCAETNVYQVGLVGFCQAALIAAAPAGAVTAQPFVVMTHNGTQADPFMFWTRVYVGEATATQTEATPWGPAGLTEITGGLIRTGTIVAGHIAANTITAAKIAAGTITATQIASGAITADMITTGSMSADRITTGTLSANRISGGTISGVSINIGSGNFQVSSSGGINANIGAQFTGITVDDLNVEDDLSINSLTGTNRTMCISGTVVYTVASGVAC